MDRSNNFLSIVDVEETTINMATADGPSVLLAALNSSLVTNIECLAQFLYFSLRIFNYSQNNNKTITNYV